MGIYAPVTAEATRETPGVLVTLSSASISSSETITISGMNFPAFAIVAEDGERRRRCPAGAGSRHFHRR